VTNDGIVKLADFGCSTKTLLSGTGGHSEPLHSAVGTTQFMAPEILQCGQQQQGEGKGEGKNARSAAGEEEGYGRKADIWSLGMTVIEMAQGRPAWPNAANAIYNLCVTGHRPATPALLSSKEAEHFLGACFERLPKLRPSASELLEHPFVVPSPAAGAGRAPRRMNECQSLEKNQGSGVAAQSPGGGSRHVTAERSDGGGSNSSSKLSGPRSPACATLSAPPLPTWERGERQQQRAGGEDTNLYESDFESESSEEEEEGKVVEARRGGDGGGGWQGGASAPERGRSEAGSRCGGAHLLPTR
jgi:serine/threonine protein kinase